MMVSDDERRIRYDRQVRLWGSGVQQRLHATVLIAFGCSADETLKNLVLAGLGRVRIVPGAVVRPAGVSDVHFLSKSVVALSSSSAAASSSSVVPSPEDAIVDGLRQLNNLVDVKIYDSSEAFEDAACVIALVEPSAAANSTFQERQREQLAAVKKTVDLVVDMRFLTQSFAFCEFSRPSSSSSQQQQQQQQQTRATTNMEPWTLSSPIPPVAALLHRGTTSTTTTTTTTSATKQSSKENDRVSADAASASATAGDGAESEEDNAAFVGFVTKMLQEEPAAMSVAGSHAVEMVAAECLLHARNKQQSPSTALNTMLGGVLSQQVIAHACVANNNRDAAEVSAGAGAGGGGGGAASGQPKPVRWFFVQMRPHIECVTG